MKPFTLVSLLLLAAAIAGLVLTNPSPETYNAYASQQAKSYLQNEVCDDIPEDIRNFLPGQCSEIVQTFQPEIDTIIREQTQRLNLGVASVYRTSLGIPQLPMLPRYQVETLGIAQQLITYRAERVR